MNFFTIFVSLLLAMSGGNSSHRHAAVAAPGNQTITGEEVKKQFAVDFGRLPEGWVNASDVMDEVWSLAGLRGVNYYAYGGPTSLSTTASRMDIRSPLYQVWFGVYVIPNPNPKTMTSKNATATTDTAVKLADMDQRSWLVAMGDPQPLGLVKVELHRADTVRIDGADRVLYTYKGKSHSDVGAKATPLRQSFGPMNDESWKSNVPPFHELELRGQFAFWTDSNRHLTIIVYSVAPVFTTNDGQKIDLFPNLEKQFLAMMQNIRIKEAKTSTEN
jgi:hypothetical protein